MLGIRPDAAPADVVEAFRRFASLHHPDHGGDPATFQAGVEAYRRLQGRRRAPANVTFYRRPRAGVPSFVRAATRRLASLRLHP
ncbi:MAG TPA: hypothetical protein VMZ73_00765 [Acidimicrobiales bacterium]|nr:hypothetical protein [Acidimicrobiales bacterium]